jgi:hypothetical protein
MDNNSLQINLPVAFHKLFESIRKRINTEDLAGKGLLVGSPHITTRYGIKKKCSHLFPFFIKMGRTTTFPPSVHSEGTAPLIIKIESMQLVALNALIDKELPVIPANFNYSPHLTLAYIKQDMAHKYVDIDLMEGMEFLAKELVLVNKDNSEVTIKML